MFSRPVDLLALIFLSLLQTKSELICENLKLLTICCLGLFDNGFQFVRDNERLSVIFVIAERKYCAKPRDISFESQIKPSPVSMHLTLEAFLSVDITDLRVFHNLLESFLFSVIRLE